jgi:hypothetical protein
MIRFGGADRVMRRLPALALGAYLVAATAGIAPAGLSRLGQISGLDSDFGFFVGAGERVLRDGRAELFDTQYLKHRLTDPVAGRFAYPPIMAVLYSPLSVLPPADARLVYLIVSCTALGGLVATATVWARSARLAILGGLAVASFWPVYEVLRLGHPTLVLAMVSASAMLAWQRGNALAAGVLMSLLGLKPPLVAAPLGLALWRRNRAWVVCLSCLLVLGALPFLAVGARSILDYVELVSASRYDAFHLQGRIHSGAALMFNWNGFWGRLLLRDPEPLLVFPFYLVTLLLMVRVWIRRGFEEAWLAGAITTMLALPHALYYDWVMLLPPALAVAFKHPGRGIVFLLIGVHLAVNISVYQIVPFNDNRALILATPVAFALLVSLAIQPSVTDLSASASQASTRPCRLEPSHKASTGRGERHYR